MTLILSLHIPKTAGSTLVASYEDAFGVRALSHNVHPDIVYTTPKNELEERYDIIYGHLDLDRLKGIIDAETKILTFLRDPVQRVVSSYHYHTKPEVTGDVAQVVQGQNMSLEKFSGLPSQLNLQSRMISPVGKERIDFIGFSERFSESLQELSEFLGVTLENKGNANVNPKKNTRDNYSLPEDIAALIRSRNQADQELYDWALARRTAG